ncbi:hypothetical protein [Nocardia crassostreae]|uniref:hypothetical protein n=1 Tax=Nocardia crassostreae TaxID=53428 RepID=UPI000AD84894|nr:hypothetical protein [Nocardia crassostreae]
MESANARPVRTAAPWHLWPIGVFFLLLNAIGAYDYIETHTHDADYFARQGYGPDQIAYFTDYPPVPLAFWTINIAAGLATAALLLFRSRRALPAAATATISQLCLQAVSFGFMDRWSILGARLGLFDSGVLVLTAALWWYCQAMRNRGALG